MNSYLVRIYRKAENDPHMLLGVVEEIGKTDRKAFKNLRELWAILNPKKGELHPSTRNKKVQKGEGTEEVINR
jgi:hypothetical protein